MVKVNLLEDVFEQILVAKDANQVAQLPPLRAENWLHDQPVNLCDAVEKHKEVNEVNLGRLLAHQRIKLLLNFFYKTVLVFSVLACDALCHALWDVPVVHPGGERAVVL
jgi:hypothetical protein